MKVKQFMNLRGKLVPRRFFIFLRVDEEGADNWPLYIQVKSALPSSDAVTHIRDINLDYQLIFSIDLKVNESRYKQCGETTFPTSKICLKSIEKDKY